MSEIEQLRAEEVSKEHKVVAMNMPFNTSEEKIMKLFNGAHSIERHTKKGVLTGVVFIQCRNASDAKRFIDTLNGVEFEGRTIRVSQLLSKEDYKAKVRGEKAAAQEGGVQKKPSAVQREKESGEGEGEKKKEETENERGRRIREQYERKRPSLQGEEDRTVFIRNLSQKTTKEEITACFSKYGSIDQCTLVTDKNSSVPTGKAFVLFAEPEGCKGALREQIVLGDRVLVVMKYLHPDSIKQRDSEKASKDKKRLQKIEDRKTGQIEPMDPSKLSSCRVHISHIHKKLNRKLISQGVEEYFQKHHDKKIRLRGINVSSDSSKRNPGYAFITFKFPEDAAVFLENQRLLKSSLGAKMTAEYAMESKEFLEKGIKKKPSKEERLSRKKN
ncbi:hypothetical protein NECID01_1666 [Nematocida sp. AWRm77]|nr:hypothetical protein NECID01_1666 [Nematocida sp. AWRm77]